MIPITTQNDQRHLLKQTNEIILKISAAFIEFYSEIHMELQKTETVLENNKKSRGLTLHNFKTYDKVTITKKRLYCHMYNIANLCNKYN